jgi:hypothetical protein
MWRGSGGLEVRCTKLKAAGNGARPMEVGGGRAKCVHEQGSGTMENRPGPK